MPSFAGAVRWHDVKHPHLDRFTLGRMQNPVRGLLHGSAALFAAVGCVLIVLAAPTWPSRIAVLAFGLTMIALFATSSLYHSVPWSERWKRRMQRADHSMIAIFIAGTYTPVAVIGLDGVWSVVSLLGAWLIALVVTGQQILFPRDKNTFGIAMMTTLGWLAIFVMWPFAQKAGVTPVLWFAVGGVLYTIGMVMLVTGRPRLWPRVFSYHEMFHVLVVIATALHFTAMWRYVVPLAA
jgi:hemolysin III